MHAEAAAAAVPALLNLGLAVSRRLRARVLIVGDADLSYATALARQLGDSAEQICATTYESEEDLFRRYPHAPEAVATLRTAGARVNCGIDARQLAEHFPGEPAWDRIVFNLPQSPPQAKARNQIQRHRQLLRDFCSSAAAVLSPDGQVWVTLLAGQGGTPLDPIQRLHGDTWQLQHEAARAALLLTSVDVPDLDGLIRNGYTPTGRGYRGRALGSWRQAQGLVSHVLEPHGAEHRSVAPLEWAFDNSFWVEGTPRDEASLAEIGRSGLGEAADALAGPPQLLDMYESAEGRHARTLRFCYRSDRLPLSRERALALNSSLCEAIAAAGAGQLRVPGEGAAPAADAAPDAAASVPTPAAPPPQGTYGGRWRQGRGNGTPHDPSTSHEDSRA